jgi:hypothetical protein
MSPLGSRTAWLYSQVGGFDGTIGWLAAAWIGLAILAVRLLDRNGGERG